MPTTEEQYERPLLIFPPWINKYYILDLGEKNSFVKWATARGYTVFVVSWVNPDARLAQKTFEDYMREGIFEALDAVEKATGAKEVNTIGYCIGGTLLSATLAYMAAKGDNRIKSATFFAAQADFSEAGDLQVFIDDEQLQSMEETMKAQGGYLDGAKMATTFNMLRSNDLIWSFVVNNYLLGNDPMRFDLLYWNSDTTRMPIAMHMFYLRECYKENNLAKGKMVLGGEKLDLVEGEDPDLPAVVEGRSHRALPLGLQVDQAVQRPDHLHDGGLRPHRRRHQSARRQQVPALDQRQAAREGRRLDRRRNRKPRLLVAPLGQVAVEALRQESPRPRHPATANCKVIEDAPGTYAKMK